MGKHRMDDALYRIRKMWMGSRVDSGTGKRQMGLHRQSGMWENVEWRELVHNQENMDRITSSSPHWENPLVRRNQKSQ